MKALIFKYQLERYKGPGSRFKCPNCGRKREFTRYIDMEEGQYLHANVGKCNRSEKCGYHFTPKQFFEDSGLPGCNPKVAVTLKSKPISFLGENMINLDFQITNLYRFLCHHFEQTDVERVMAMYRVGASKKWDNAVVFYLIDRYSRYRSGKIMAYNPVTGKRIKQPYNHVAWLHSGLGDFNLKQCLFGEHLLAGNSAPVCIVESEKTAIIMALKQPEYIWLATGGLGNLNRAKICSLGCRKIILFPDAGCADKWAVKAKGTSAVVDRQLEAYPEGTDLADVLVSNIEQ